MTKPTPKEIVQALMYQAIEEAPDRNDREAIAAAFKTLFFDTFENGDGELRHALMLGLFGEAFTEEILNKVRLNYLHKGGNA